MEIDVGVIGFLLRIFPFLSLLSAAGWLSLTVRRTNLGKPSFVALCLGGMAPATGIMAALLPLRGTVEWHAAGTVVWDALALVGTVIVMGVTLVAMLFASFTNPGRDLLTREKGALFLALAAATALLPVAGHGLVLAFSLLFSFLAFSFASAFHDVHGRSLEVGVKVFGTGALLGSLLTIGAVCLFFQTGTLGEAALGAIALDGTMPLATIGVGIFVFSLAVAMGIFPCHFWLVDAVHALPPLVAAFGAVSLRCAAFLGFERFFVHGMRMSAGFPFHLLGVLGGIGALGASWCLFGQRSLGRRFGFLMAAAGADLLVLLWAGIRSGGTADAIGLSLWCVAAHAVSCAALLAAPYLAGARASGDLQVEHLKGMGAERPLAAILLSLGVLGCCAAPPIVFVMMPAGEIVAILGGALLLRLWGMAPVLRAIWSRAAEPAFLEPDPEVTHWVHTAGFVLCVLVVLVFASVAYWEIPFVHFTPHGK